MRCFGFIAALLLLSLARLQAQSIGPAQPADPAQARHALPVASDDLAPTHPDSPVTNAVAATPPAGASVSVIAESSLKAVLQELAQAWADSQSNAPQVPLSLTNSGTLRAKIESGVNFDLVISADVTDMKAMTDKGYLLADGQRSLARNTVVIYGRKALVKDDDLDWTDLVGTEWKKVALGNPDQVASGRVARRALVMRGLNDDDHKSVYVYAMTDALAINVVKRDQADAVFAYKTDVWPLKLSGFEIYPMKTDDAPPVFYIAAITHFAKNPGQARAFLDYCSSEAAKPVWVKYGFETN